jgi:hypothetical protein
MTMNDDTASRTSRGAAAFSVREFARTARGSHRGTLDLAEYATKPLSSETLRMVRYLRDLEAATMQYLRNVLVTPTHKDARVTAFLVTWAFEKFWIADALAAVLEANGVEHPSTGEETKTGPQAKRRHTLSEAGERRGPIWRAVSAIVVGAPIVAAHMTTELVDHWITGAAYERLAESAKSDALRSTIDLVLGVKARHAQFFEEESRRRLAESPRAVRLTSRALVGAAWPVGAIERSAADRTFFEEFTFGADKGTALAAAIEARVASLPGIGERVAATVRGRLAS